MARERIVVLYNTDYDAEQAATANNPDATSVRASAKAIASALIETGYTVELTRERVDIWAASLEGVERRWLLPAPGTPMHLSRADLVLARA